ncbi:putative Protein lysine acetyltransferase Pat [Streptomyces misionensis JCM 4497]
MPVLLGEGLRAVGREERPRGRAVRRRLQPHAVRPDQGRGHLHHGRDLRRPGQPVQRQRHADRVPRLGLVQRRRDHLLADRRRAVQPGLLQRCEGRRGGRQPEGHADHQPQGRLQRRHTHRLDRDQGHLEGQQRFRQGVRRLLDGRLRPDHLGDEGRERQAGRDHLPRGEPVLVEPVHHLPAPQGRDGRELQQRLRQEGPPRVGRGAVHRRQVGHPLRRHHVRPQPEVVGPQGQARQAGLRQPGVDRGDQRLQERADRLRLRDGRRKPGADQGAQGHGDPQRRKPLRVLALLQHQVRRPRRRDRAQGHRGERRPHPDREDPVPGPGLQGAPARLRHPLQLPEGLPGQPLRRAEVRAAGGREGTGRGGLEARQRRRTRQERQEARSRLHAPRRRSAGQGDRRRPRGDAEAGGHPPRHQKGRRGGLLQDPQRPQVRPVPVGQPLDGPVRRPLPVRLLLLRPRLQHHRCGLARAGPGDPRHRQDRRSRQAGRGGQRGRAEGAPGVRLPPAVQRTVDLRGEEGPRQRRRDHLLQPAPGDGRLGEVTAPGGGRRPTAAVPRPARCEERPPRPARPLRTRRARGGSADPP